VTPKLEFIVAGYRVTEHLGGPMKLFRLRGTNAGYEATVDCRQKDIGRTVFFSKREAAQAACRKTTEYERTWRWAGGEPMRRSWKHLLDEPEPPKEHRGCETCGDEKCWSSETAEHYDKCIDGGFRFWVPKAGKENGG
jgi:hypothetical protein